MIQAIGDGLWKVGQTFIQTGQLIGQAIGNTVTCGQGCTAKELQEAGEELKHDTEVLLTEKEQLEDQVKELHAKLENLGSTHEASNSEASDRLKTQITELKEEIDQLETDAVTNLTVRDEEKIDHAAIVELKDEEIKDQAEQMIVKDGDIKRLEAELKSAEESLEKFADHNQELKDQVTKAESSSKKKK